MPCVLAATAARASHGLRRLHHVPLPRPLLRFLLPPPPPPALVRARPGAPGLAAPPERTRPLLQGVRVVAHSGHLFAGRPGVPRRHQQCLVDAEGVRQGVGAGGRVPCLCSEVGDGSALEEGDAGGEMSTRSTRREV